MELLSRNYLDSFLAGHGIVLEHSSYPKYISTIKSYQHGWHCDWDIKQIPLFFTLLVDAFDQWDWCLVAKSANRNQSPGDSQVEPSYFRFEYDCPVMGTKCIVTPDSIDQDGDVDDCTFFDAFCTDHWSRFDAVQSLNVPGNFQGALRLDRSETQLLTDIMLMTHYFGDPWDDLAIYPNHCRQIYCIDHDSMVITIYRDVAWHKKVEALVAQNLS